MKELASEEKDAAMLQELLPEFEAFEAAVSEFSLKQLMWVVSSIDLI